MRMATIAVAVSTTTTVATVTNAVALVNAMALLATPVTLVIYLVQVNCSQGANRLSHNPNFAFGKGGSGG